MPSWVQIKIIHYFVFVDYQPGFAILVVAVAQSMERVTSRKKVMGSIPGCLVPYWLGRRQY